MNDENLKGGRQFSSGYQPARRGRYPSALKDFIKENRVSKADLDAVFKDLIFGKTLAELHEMVKPDNKDKLPVIVVLLISAFLKDERNGTLLSTNAVLDRIFGKPAQSADVKVSGVQFLKVTDEDEAALR